jgi:hypothetical protein
MEGQGEYRSTGKAGEKYKGYQVSHLEVGSGERKASGKWRAFDRGPKRKKGSSGFGSGSGSGCPIILILRCCQDN